MYAVIFTAEIASLDSDYTEMAKRMRELAIDQYGCLGFTSCAEGGREIAVSYWESEAQIGRWKRNAEHLAAQHLGQNKWYTSYQVEVVEIVRSYGSGGSEIQAWPG